MSNQYGCSGFDKIFYDHLSKKIEIWRIWRGKEHIFHTLCDLKNIFICIIICVTEKRRGGNAMIIGICDDEREIREKQYGRRTAGKWFGESI